MLMKIKEKYVKKEKQIMNSEFRKYDGSERNCYQNECAEGALGCGGSSPINNKKPRTYRTGPRYTCYVGNLE